MQLTDPSDQQPSRTRQRRGPAGLMVGLAFFLGILPALLVALAIYMPGPLEQPKNIVIPRHASVRDIALLLQAQGATNNPVIFRLAARILAKNGLYAGEFSFTAGQSIADEVLMLHDETQAVVRRFTIPEGLTTAEIVIMLRNEPAMSGDVAAIPLEGSLHPETYHFTYGDNRQKLIDRMQKAQRELLEELWPKRDAGLPVSTPEQAMTAASMIEKETGKKAEERARVAGVFYNRLRHNMRLQSDPTVIYALTKGQGPLQHELTHEDMAYASPYNTYVTDGLPPHPICNPGRASIEAALHPETNDYLYFVADGTGGHAFAKDLAQHNKNVAHWLSLLRP